MPDALIPQFDPSHLWTEQVVVLQTGPNIYGRITIYYPTALNGDPDIEGTRQPVFMGNVLLNGRAANGQSVQVPLTFLIPAQDAISAAMMFAEFGNKAAEEFQRDNFRQALVMPGHIKQ